MATPKRTAQSRVRSGSLASSWLGRGAAIGLSGCPNRLHMAGGVFLEQQPTHPRAGIWGHLTGHASRVPCPDLHPMGWAGMEG
jgi:hypothetical protein